MVKKRDHGTGTVSYEERRHKWIGRIQIGVVDGRRRWREVSADTRKEAGERLEALRKQVTVNTQADGRQKVADYLEWWLTESVAPVRNPRTLASYRQVVRLYLAPTLGHHKLYDLNPQHVQAMVNQLAKRVSPRTVQYTRDVLRNALNRAIRLGHVARNAATYVDVPAVRRVERRPLSLVEARTLLRTIQGNRLETLFTVSLELGLRPGEAEGLRWSDVDLEHGMLTARVQLQRAGGGLALVPLKTERSRRTIPLPDFVLQSLKQQRVRWLEARMKAGPDWQGDRWDLVFFTATGGPLSARNVVRDFKAVLVAAGLPDVRLYDLRHTTPTLLQSLGVDARTIMEILGHSQISVTLNTYTHVDPSMTRAAMASLDDALAGEK